MSKEFDSGCDGCRHDELDTRVCGELNCWGILAGVCDYRDDEVDNTPAPYEYPQIETTLKMPGNHATLGGRPVTKREDINSNYL